MKTNQVRQGDSPSAVLYIRVASVAPQDQRDGISEQREACKRYAERHGATITYEFVDIGEKAG
jgi:DNA invertase Pin-like site-specific DNA recombinase